MSLPCAVVARDVARVSGGLFLIINLATVFAFSVDSMVLAAVEVGRSGIAGGSGQIEIGSSRSVAEGSCSFVFNQNCTDEVECLFFNRSVLEDVHNIGELLGKGREDAHNQVSLCNFIWSPFQLLTDIRK